MTNQYNDVCDYDFYLETREDILKKKSFPFLLHNKPLAEYCFRHFKSEYETSTMIEFDNAQYICYDKRAVMKVKKIIKTRIDILNQKKAELTNLLSALEEG